MPIQLKSVASMRGASAWASQPVVHAILQVEGTLPPACMAPLERAFERWTPRSEDGVVQRLARLLHWLLREQGCPVFDETQALQPQAGTWLVVLPTAPGLEVLTKRLLAAAVQAVNTAQDATGAAPALQELLDTLRALRREAPRGKNTLPMLEAAHRGGIPWDRLAGSVYRLGQGCRARWFQSSITDRTPSISVQLARHKHHAAEILRRLNIPVPRHVLVRCEEQALKAAETLGYPVVVKPASEDRGVGVAARLRDAQAVSRAYREAAKFGEFVLVEEHFFGDDHRIHVFEGEVFRIRRRVPGGVTGDGRSTVAQLLERLNADPLRGPPGTDSELIRIDLDEEALDLLGERGMQAASVPPEGDFVQLRRIANVSVGGVSHPVDIADVHPDNLALAVRAVRALGLDLAAVDFLIPDIRRSWTDVGAAICEINAQPQFGAGAPEWLFSRMFPGAGRIPIVAVVGTVAWLPRVRALVAAAGVRLGYCDAGGTWAGSDRLSGPLPLGAFGGAGILLEDRSVQAILLVADDHLIANGMPSARIDAMVLGGKPSQEMDPQLARCVAVHAERAFYDAAAAASWRRLRPFIRCAEQAQVPEAELPRLLAALLAPRDASAPAGSARP